jgi:dihydropteroate synthase
MNSLASYIDVAAEVTAELEARLRAAVAAGVAPDVVMLDPGFGFAKTAEHNLELLQRLPALLALGRPLLAGISRKNTIGTLSGEPDPKGRTAGSVAAALMAVDRGARILRVHDVPETVQALKVWTGLRSEPPAAAVRRG